MINPSATDSAQAIRQAIEAVLHISTMASDIAHAKRNLYEAYIAEGFSKEQALELTKSLGGGVI